MTDAPVTPERLRADAVKLLEQLIAPCEGADEHSWRKCKRCAAVHGVEERFSLSIQLLRVAIGQFSRAESAERQVAAQAQEIARLREALTTLVNKLDAVHFDPRYQAVWTLYHVHGGNYTEPRYDAELNAAKATLAASRPIGANEEQP